jgi:hypothetical protein
LVGRVVEHLFGKKAENDHVVLANGQVRSAGSNDLVDESRPVVRPFLLEDGYEYKIELVQKRAVRLEGLLGVGGLDNKVHDEVANA